MLPLTIKLRLLDQAHAAATPAVESSYWLRRSEGFEVSGRVVQSAARRSDADRAGVGPVISAAGTDMAIVSTVHRRTADAVIRTDQSGQMMAEYAVVLGVITIAVVVTLGLLSTVISGLLTT